MSYCLNPVCTQPQNSDVTFCQSCGKKLLLREHYRAVRQIGQGGFGKTFLAVDQDLPNKPACVIKQFSPQIQGTSGLQKATELFEQEAVQLNILGKHPQIPELLAHFEQDGRLYLVQEYVKGRNLAEELAQDGAFSEAKIRELLVGLLPVLQYIHDNQVIHRDIKPENIIRRDDGVLFLVDFGAVKLATNSAMFKTGTFIGTAEYASPEQMRGKSRPASDLYSLGVTCLNSLVDMSPFDLVDIDNKWIWEQYLKIKKISLDKDLKLILNKMTEPTISLRYQSASDVLKVLNWETEIEEVENNIVQIATVSEVAIEVNVQAEEISQIITPVNLKPVSIGNKYEYQDESGKVFSKVPFEDASEFSEGFAAVKYNGKWGFIDGTGAIVIEPQFYRAYSFYSGLARVIDFEDYKYHFVNTTGQIAFSLEYNCVGDFVGAIAPVGIVGITTKRYWSGNERRIDMNVYIRCMERWYDNESYTEQKDIPWNDGKYGFIYTNGDLVTDLEFDWISTFVNGYAVVRIDNQYDLVNLRGQTILNKWRTHSPININRRFDEDLILLCEHNKYRLIKESGVVNKYERVYPEYYCREFDDIEYFYEENFSEPYRVAKFKIDGKYGLINKKCKIILEPKYDHIKFIKFNSYSETKNCDIALVVIEDKAGFKVGLINRDGRILLEPTYQDSIFGYNKNIETVFLQYNFFIVPYEYSGYTGIGHFYKINIGTKWGLIKLYGGGGDSILAEPKYWYIGRFSEGVAIISVGKKYGIINQDGKKIIDPDTYSDDCYYSHIREFKNGRAIARFYYNTTSIITAILYSIVNRNYPVSYGEFTFYTEQILDLRGKIVKE